jgi:glycosyltransferase involved in cell wall biosynthesis
MNARVLMTADAVGGVWSYALELARGLARADVETTLAIFGPAPDDEQVAEACTVAGLTLIETGFPLDWDTNVDAAGIERAAGGLADLAAAGGADIVHLNSPIFASGMRFPAPVVGFCHSCVSTWWQAVKGEAPLPEAFVWRGEKLRDAYQRCQVLVAPSAAFAAATAAVHRLPAKPVVVHNGRDTHSPVPATKPARMIFTAGRLWDEGKNVATLDRAAAALDIPVHAAGPLAAPDGRTVHFEHLRTPGRLTEAQMGDWLSARPVFASVSRYEPFGLAVLEAARAGCALVLSDIPSFRELWHGVASFVPAGDPAAIATALQQLLDQEWLRRRYGRKAAKRAAVYSTALMAERMLEIYASVSGSRGFDGRVAA